MPAGRGRTGASCRTASTCPGGAAPAPAGSPSCWIPPARSRRRSSPIYVGNLLGLIEETGPEQIAIIQCDTAVKKVDYLGPGETIDRIEVHGRGGTLFQPAFTWIAESGFDPHIIVYATDLASRDQPDRSRRCR